MRVEDGLFVLGCFERRVTFASQQVRALNLVYALHERRLLPHDGAIAVVGGGVAGMTAAAAAARLGYDVTLLEQGETLLPLLAGNTKRWIHPHVYDWPDDSRLPEQEEERDWAQVPLLRWKAAPAGDVARQIKAQWDALPERERIRVCQNVKGIDLGHGSPRDVSWNAPGFNHGAFAVVILAVGFGLEQRVEGIDFVSYWDDDNLDKTPLGSANYLISGTGDGGLIDVVRARLNDFRHDEVLETFVGDASLGPVKEELLTIEREARDRERVRAGSSSAYLYEAYKKLSAPTVDAAIEHRLRKSMTVTLNGIDKFPFSLDASILNRFLVSRLIFRFGLAYRHGKLEPAKKTGACWEVRFPTGKPEVFDRIIWRHGPKPAALEEGFPQVWEKCANKSQARAVLDQTRWPIYNDRTFAPKVGEATPISAATRGMTNEPSSTPEPAAVSSLPARLADSQPSLPPKTISATPALSPELRRFNVLLLSTEKDLSEAHAAVKQHLDRAYGVEVVSVADDLTGFDLIVLIQAYRWEGGQHAALWNRVDPERREAFLSRDADEADWPPPRLVERAANAEVEAFRSSLANPHIFRDPAELPEQIGQLVADALQKQRGDENKFGLHPWERAYLQFASDAWRRGRTHAGRTYLIARSAQGEPYVPDLYISLDGTAPGWICNENDEPTRGEATRDLQTFQNPEQRDPARVPIARWITAPTFSRLALVGAPGGGKTVFLTRLAAALADACLGLKSALEHTLQVESLRTQGGSPPVPVVLEASRLAGCDVSAGAEALIAALAHELSKGGQGKPDAEALREGLRQGRYFVLVDALDEIADGDQRRRTLELLRGFVSIKDFARTRILLATRSAAYTGSLDFGGFAAVEIAPLDRKQIKAFCDAWGRYRNLNALLLLGLREAATGLDMPIRSGSDGDRSLTGTPLMLTAISIIYEKHRSLPRDRGRLCELLIGELCGSRQSEDFEHNFHLDEEQKRDLLERLALAMQEAGAQRWSQRHCAEALRSSFPGDEQARDFRAQRAIQWLTEHTGLIRFEGNGDEEQIRFWHRLFREYLAARQLARQDKVVRVLVDDLWESKHLVDPFWGDVIQLLPRALGTSEKALALIQGLQELAAAHAFARGRLLGLAAACMIESRELFPGVLFPDQAKELARTYDSEGLTWALPDRRLVLEKLALLDPEGGDPRFHEDRWINISSRTVTLGDEVGDLVKGNRGVPPREVKIEAFAVSWAPLTFQEFSQFALSPAVADNAFWMHVPKKLIKGIIEQLKTRYGTEGWSRSHQNIPLFGISYYGALAYCKWRTSCRSDGRTVRLLTEAEWETIARAPGSGRYPWGDALEDRESKYEDLELDTTAAIFDPVGLYRPNEFGIVGLVESLICWCDSLYSEAYGISATQKASIQGGVIAPTWILVARGGVDSAASGIPSRCAYRRRIAQESSILPGIRLVLDPPP